MSKKYRLALLLIFGFLLGGRWLISGSGYLEDTDELLYLYIIKNYDALVHFNPEPWVRAIFDMQGQPPEIALRLFESLFGYGYQQLTGTPMAHPDALYVIGLFNIAVSLLILYVFSRILRRLEFSPPLVLLGVLLLGTLVNMNIYTRHILPYDTALLFHLLSLNTLLGQPLTRKRVLLAGLWMGLGLTNYYGTFMLVFVQMGLLAFAQPRSLWMFVKHAFLFFLPLLGLVLFYESLTRIFCHDSYLKFLLFYVDTINQGSFSEGLVYVFTYFHLVEKGWGLFLLVLFFAGVLAIIRRAPKNANIRHLLLLGVTAYLVYGTYVYVFEKMVFFGRVLHIYYPFIIVGVLCLFDRLKPNQLKIAGGVLALGAIINYAWIIQDLNQIGYPRGTIYSQQLYEAKDEVQLSYREEIFGGIRYEDREMWEVDSLGSTNLPAGNYDLVNFAFLMHHPDSFMTTYRPYELPGPDRTVYKKLHFQSHPVYTLEYCSAEGRRFFLEKKLQIRVVQTDSLGQLPYLHPM